MSSLFLVERNAVAAEAQDAEAREQALDIRRSFLVEAPAGSGKTGLLIQRYLKLLADEGVSEPEQVLAITFTVKATAELRERVVAQLMTARDGVEPVRGFDRLTRPMAMAALARDAEAGWCLLDSPYRLNIRTIDSVCGQIATSLPVLSGSGGAASPVTDAEPLYREAARRTLMLLGGSDAALNEALAALLLHRDGNLGNCEALIAEMLGVREQWGELVPLDKRNLDEAYLDGTVLPKLERALEMVICRALTQLGKVMPEPLQHEIAMLARKMSAAPGYSGESPIAICRELRSAPGQAAKDLAHWRALVGLALKKDGAYRVRLNVNDVGFMISKQDRDELKAQIDQMSNVPGLCEALCSLTNLPPAQYPGEQWRVAKPLFRVLSRALAELQQVFAERGQCDFTEVSLLAKQALQREGAADGLNAALGSNLRHLLVDETQDTSNSQYELLRLLTQFWDGRGQTVFLVGDPKQSIYRFRQARVEHFVHAMLDGRLGNIPLTTQRLTANFRSQPALVGDFNESFSAIFPETISSAQPEEVPYSKAIAMRERSLGAGWVWHPGAIAYSEDAEIRSDSARRQAVKDALAIRRIVSEWRQRPLPPGRSEPWTIAVLVRSRTHLCETVAALKRTDEGGAMPYRAIEIEPLGERQEILDAFALTRALLHPADRVAWFAVLRAPWCGLTLADLHRLSGEDDETLSERTVVSLIEERGHELSEDGCARLARLWPAMEAAERQRGQLRLADWVEQTWRSLGTAAFASEEQLSNLRRFFDLLEELEASGGRIDVTMLQARLAKLFAEPSLDPGAVDLMTIHKAKGLEWDVVLVPALERTTGRDKNRLLTWMEIETGDTHEDGLAHGILAPIAGKGQENQPLNCWMKSVENARERAEQKRLLYVACTRAKEELHLFAAPQQKKDSTFSPASGSLLASAWPVAKDLFHVPDEAELMVEVKTFDLAATAPRVSHALPLMRIPNTFMPPVGPPRLGPRQDSPPPRALFERPQGSFAARCFGNTMHAMLEALTRRAESGMGRELLLRDLPRWTPRVAAILRGAGLPPTLVERYAERVVAGLISTLNDANGWWLIGPHTGSRAEESIVSWNGEDRRMIRVDRLFHAGAEPSSPGEDHLWIVDYKTATHGRANVDEFLEQEKERYAPQLEAYARQLAVEDRPLRLGLYYPMLAKLLWWQPSLPASS